MRFQAFGLILAMAASGCVVAPDAPGKGRAVPVLEGAVQVGLPRGFCADPRSGGETVDTAVVIMGRCPGETRATPAVVTVTVGVPGSAGVMTADGRELAAFFTSPQGKATLASTGRPGDVLLRTALSVDDAFVMQLEERGTGPYWRAVLGLKGRLVTVSVRGGPGMDLPTEQGRDLLDATLLALRRANAG